MTSETTTLEQTRYGRTESSRRRGKLVALLGGISVAVVITAWVWWAGLLQPSAQFQTRDLGYVVVNERTIDVRFDVTAPPGTELGCAVQALNASYGIVGWKVIDLPASTDRTRVFVERLRTSEPPVTGLLYRCWVP